MIAAWWSTRVHSAAAKIASVEAIKRLQAKHGLKADGLVGPATRAALGI